MCTIIILGLLDMFFSKNEVLSSLLILMLLNYLSSVEHERYYCDMSQWFQVHTIEVNGACVVWLSNTGLTCGRVNEEQFCGELSL